MDSSGFSSPPRSVESRAASSTSTSGPYKTKEGDVLGGNTRIPRGDFGAFLGYRPPTQQELSGQAEMSGSRVIELSLQKELGEVGKRAVARGDDFRNHYTSWETYTNQPGREKDLFRDMEDSLKQGVERRTDEFKPGAMGSSSAAQYMKVLDEYHQRSKQDNMRYLEMQYKFLYASKSFGTISNMMKVRHDAIVRAVRESR